MYSTFRDFGPKKFRREKKNSLSDLPKCIKVVSKILWKNFTPNVHRAPEKVTNPYKDFSSTTILYNICPDMFLRHVESFLQAALPSAWFKLIFSQGW